MPGTRPRPSPTDNRAQRTPVTIGSRFGDWQVCWLGGWTRHRLSYLVMLVRIKL